MSNFHLLFYIRKQKNYKGGAMPIYMNIPEPLNTLFRNSKQLIRNIFDHSNLLINNCDFQIAYTTRCYKAHGMAWSSLSEYPAKLFS